jgi:hypothetical protein
MLATTILFWLFAILIKERWPLCKAPIVGTKPIGLLLMFFKKAVYFSMLVKTFMGQI